VAVRSFPIFSNFSAGEVSPLMFGRVDLEKYSSGLETLENFILLPYGGVTARPGTRFIVETKHSASNENRKVMLRHFIFNRTQGYILEFGHLYIRFYRDQAQLMSGGSPVQVVTPYLESQLFGLDFVQTADVLYIVHGSHAPRRLARTSDTVWTFTSFRDAGDVLNPTAAAAISGPSFAPPAGPTTLADVPAASTPLGIRRTSHVIVVASTAEDGSDASVYAANKLVKLTVTIGGALWAVGDVGEILKLGEDADKGFVKIKTFLNSTSVIVELKSSTSPGSYSVFFRVAWSTSLGFPKAITVFEQRLVFAGTNDLPNGIWGSVSGDFENFEQGVESDDSFLFLIGSNQINSIQWLSSERTLLIGTEGDEYRLTGSPVTPTNVDIKRQSSHGSQLVKPIQIGPATIFLQRAGRKMRALEFNRDKDVYIAPDITVLAEHISESGIVQMAYQQEPHSLIWIARNDGILAALTYYPEQNVSGWHRHSSPCANFETVAVIPSTDGSRDELWTVARRVLEIPNGLFARWCLNESDGGIAHEDVSGKAGKLIDMGPCLPVNPWEKGFAGNALHFTGAGYVAIPVDSIPSSGDVSFAFLFSVDVNYDGILKGDQAIIHYADDNSQNDFRINLYGEDVGGDAQSSDAIAGFSQGVLAFRVWKKSSSEYVNVSSNATSWSALDANGARQWYACICTFSEANGLRMYIGKYGTDASIIKQTDTEPGFVRDGTGIKTTLAAIGAHTYTKVNDINRALWFFDGMIDHVRVWNREIGETEADTIYKSFKRYVEVFDPKLSTDAAITSTNTSPQTSVSATHLKGLTVDVVGDCNPQKQKTVSASGVVTLERSAKSIEVGIPYTPTLKTLRIESGNPAGSAQSRQRHFNEVFVRVKDSSTLEINGQLVAFTKGGDLMDTAPKLFTGDQRVVNLGWDREARITLRRTQPLPCTVLAAFGTYNTGL